MILTVHFVDVQRQERNLPRWQTVKTVNLMTLFLAKYKLHFSFPFSLDNISLKVNDSLKLRPWKQIHHCKTSGNPALHFPVFACSIVVDFRASLIQRTQDDEAIFKIASNQGDFRLEISTSQLRRWRANFGTRRLEFQLITISWAVGLGRSNSDNNPDPLYITSWFPSCQNNSAHKLFFSNLLL